AGIPRAAVDGVVQRLGAAAIHRRDARAGVDQRAGDARLVGGRREVQRRVAGVDLVADLLVEELAGPAGGRELRCAGEQLQDPRPIALDDRPCEHVAAHRSYCTSPGTPVRMRAVLAVVAASMVALWACADAGAASSRLRVVDLTTGAITAQA